MDFYGFYTGKEFEAYRFLGAHACERGTIFRHLHRMHREFR